MRYFLPQSGVSGRSRKGVALMMALLTLSVLSVLMAGGTWQIYANRQLGQRRQLQLQTLWLARGGMDVAMQALARDGDYHGGTISLMQHGQVSVEVKREGASPKRYRLHCSARYPTDAPRPIIREMDRLVERRTQGARTTIDVVAVDDRNPGQ